MCNYVYCFVKLLFVVKKKKKKKKKAKKKKKKKKKKKSIPRGSRVMNIFIKRTRPAKSLVTVFYISGWVMLKYISIQNLNKIYHAVQEL